MTFYKILFLSFIAFKSSQLFAINCLIPTATKSCDFYRFCLESKIKCGETGYALAYGEKYCTKFSNLNNEISSKGKTWRDLTLKCLQVELDFGLSNNEFTTCSSLSEFAFNSHPSCYTVEAASICHLPASDWNVIRSVPDTKDIWSIRSGKQIAGVMTNCAGQLISRLNSIRSIQSKEMIINKNFDHDSNLYEEYQIIEKLKIIDEINQNE